MAWASSSPAAAADCIIYAFETEDVAHELEAAREKGLPLIDQKPRSGLAGMICFLHPKAARGVLVEYAQPFED